jgi:hypothetical protein
MRVLCRLGGDRGFTAQRRPDPLDNVGCLCTYSPFDQVTKLMKRLILVVPCLGLVLGGCAAKNDSSSDDTNAQADDDGDSGSGGGTFGEQPGTTAPADDGGGTVAGSDGVAGDSSGDGGGFIIPPDGGGVANECDQWTQDCPEGEKCMPWANDGGSAWNGTRCSPIAANAGQVGDECQVEGSGVSGVDNCDLGSMCYYVQPDTNTGICVGMCLGSPDAPQCDPGYLCSISNDGVLTLCRLTCDPLLQDCESTGAACLPAAGADGFVCIVDASGEAGAAGDPCEYLNACDPGLWCAGATAVPGCASAQGCCTEFCDLTDDDPDAACSLAGEGAVCVTWFEEGQAPPTLTHVGACLLPA